MQSITKTRKRSSCGIPNNATSPSFMPDSQTPAILLGTPIRSAVELSAKCSQLESEHDLAVNLQQDFLRGATLDDFKVNLHALCVPAEKNSGDAIETFRIDDDRIAIFMVDATGHGLAASQLAMLAVQTIRSWKAADCHSLLLEPSDVLAKLNNLICQANSRDCMFVAATYVVFNDRTQAVLLARGGNPYPVLHRRDSSPQKIESQGSLLGVLANACFENIEIQLNRGDQLAIYSDGLEDCGLADDLGMLLQAYNNSLGDSNSSFMIDDQFTAFENKLTQQAKFGQLFDDVSVAALQIPTATINETDDLKTQANAQLALA